MSNINDLINPLAAIISIIVAVPTFWTWYEVVFGNTRRFKKWGRQARTHSGTIQSALVIDLSGTDIINQVKGFIGKQEALKDLPEERILYLHKSKNLKPEDMTHLVSDFRQKINQISSFGTDELIVFFLGPVVAASVLGAELGNTFRNTHFYHYDVDGGYKNFGPLRYPSS